MDISAIGKIKRIRFRARSDPSLGKALDRILWWSFPVVYIRGEFDNLSKQYLANAARRKRYRKYIRGMISTFNEVYLLTLTFSEDYYNSTDRKTKVKYAQRCCNLFCDDYFGSLDIGKKHCREHFHIICAFNRSITLSPFIVKRKIYYSSSPQIWDYGFYSIRKIQSTDQDFYKTLNYSLKSSTYCLKSADGVSIKPFHARNVEHWEHLDSDEELPF